ncbi:hypothetical protein Val02_39790 [Virgisporangium aliadipatigenens]|uniref:Uncharacterized protein n=1 Tax=Virgisporangium aliadipatigenens TaxID=741659 RepID=A0A8J3YNW8_9ACTN|nr:hypothetical protein [Virgisporangium aliadipatigenens]GIJ47093.1 hypothetical protein Val02_39790 [Virgisporangium aliadipatigenens]
MAVRTMKPRAVEIFLLPADEVQVFDSIRRKFPNATLVDDRQWESVGKPPLSDDITECGRTVGLWHRSARPRLLGRSRADGRIELPDSDYVVQWQRSVEVAPAVLEHGRWATSMTYFDDPEMVDFVAEIWKILFALTTNRMRRSSAADPNTPDRAFRVGEKAFTQSQTGRLTLAADALRLAPEVGYEWPRRRQEG